jgi:hypothetical protein
MNREDLREEASIQFGASNHFTQLSRTICFDNAIQLARIFQCRTQRFNTRQIFVTGMQHAGTAATALIAAIALINDPAERVYPLQHLRILAKALKDMAYTYRPAERMLNVLELVIQDFGWEINSLADLSQVCLTERNLSSRNGIDNDPQQIFRKSDNSPINIGIGNPYDSTPGLTSDPQDLDSLITMDQYDDMAYTNMPFSAMTGANPMSWMKSMSADNSMMFSGRNSGLGFISPDDIMPFSAKSNTLHYLDRPRAPKDHSATREQSTIPNETMPEYNMPKKFQQSRYMDGCSLPSSTVQRGPFSFDSPMEPQLPWGQVLRQMGEIVS